MIRKKNKAALKKLDLKPLFTSNLSLGLRYKYMPARSGQNTHDSLFNADLEWAPVKRL